MSTLLPARQQPRNGYTCNAPPNRRNRGSAAAQPASLSTVSEACVLQGLACTAHPAQHWCCPTMKLRWMCTPRPTCPARWPLTHVHTECQYLGPDVCGPPPQPRSPGPATHPAAPAANHAKQPTTLSPFPQKDVFNSQSQADSQLSTYRAVITRTQALGTKALRRLVGVHRRVPWPEMGDLPWALRTVLQGPARSRAAQQPVHGRVDVAARRL